MVDYFEKEIGSKAATPAKDYFAEEIESSNPAFLPQENKVQADIASRPDSVKILMDEANTHWDPTQNPFKAAMQGPVQAMKMVNVPFQRAEATLADPALEMQKGNFNPISLASEAYKGASGQKAGQFGDLVRTTGFGKDVPSLVGGNANEMLASTLGLTAAGELGGRGIRTADKAKDAAIASQVMTQAKLDKMITDAADVHRQVLNPGIGEIRGLAKSNKTMDPAMKLAAEDGLIYDKDATGKLDTGEARKQVNSSIQNLDDELSNVLKSNEEKQFDLNKIGEEAKRNYRSSTSNDLEYETGAKHIDDQIAAAIRNRGEMVDGPTLNDVKRGMWQTSYNAGVPNAQNAARSVGYATKDAIEKAYGEDAAIQDINKKMGEYLTLDNLLTKANGRIIKGGKLGKYFSGAKGTALGSIAGGGLGAAVGHPFIGAELGGLAGNKIGEMANEIVNNPSRVTSALADKIAKAKASLNGDLPESIRHGAVTPDVVNPNEKQFSLNPFENSALPNNSAPQPLGIQNIFADRGATPPINEAIRIGDQSSGSPIQVPPEKISPEAKQQASDDINAIWYKNLTGQDLPSLGKKTAAVGAATGLGTGMFSGSSEAKQTVDINKINQIESSGNPKAIGDGGKAFGINQIHLATLADYNKAKGTNLTKEDLMDKDTNNKVADWYYNTAAPQFLKLYKIPDTIENRIAFYNEGQGNLKKRIKNGGEMPDVTKRYIKKYHGAK